MSLPSRESSESPKKPGPYTGYPVSYSSVLPSEVRAMHSDASWIQRVESQAVVDDASASPVISDTPMEGPSSAPEPTTATSQEMGVAPTTIGWIVRRCALKHWVPELVEPEPRLPLYGPPITQPLLPSCDPPASGSDGDSNWLNLPQSWIDFYCRNRVYFQAAYFVLFLIAVSILYFFGDEELWGEMARAFLCYVGVMLEYCPKH